jgi:pyridoxine/pyridoxamine 5'-phosphate oxidase
MVTNRRTSPSDAMASWRSSGFRPSVGKRIEFWEDCPFRLLERAECNRTADDWGVRKLYPRVGAWRATIILTGQRQLS